MLQDSSDIDLLVGAQFLPWELTAGGFCVSGVCDQDGTVRPDLLVIENPDSIKLVGQPGTFWGWLCGEARFDRTIVDVPFPSGAVRCHLYRIREPGRNVFGVAVPLNASFSRRVAETSGELSRTALIEDATQEAISCLRADKRLACCILRVPEVAKVQTALGSAVAELFIKEIALRLKHVLSTPRLIYELGMEAFAVLQELEGDVEAATAALEEELRRIAEQTFGYPYDIDSMVLKARGGIGYAILPNDAGDVGELLRAAEIASYHAVLRPDAGSVARCPQSALDENRENLVMAAEFYETLLSDQIEHCIQPIVDTRDGRWIGGEILARWLHPTLGPIAPPRFIGLAEEYGYITDLTVTTMRKIADWVREHRLEGLRLSFNIAPADFQPKEIARLANEVVGQGLTDVAAVVFEIVEGTVIEDLAQANEILSQIKGMGISFALDDFGTGYSSISLLQGLEIDYVKIDRSFTHGVATDHKKHRLLEAIVFAAKSFERSLVAEGVETEEDLKIVRDLEIEFTQGYYFAKPMRLEDFASSFTRAGALVA